MPKQIVLKQFSVILSWTFSSFIEKNADRLDLPGSV